MKSKITADDIVVSTQAKVLYKHDLEFTGVGTDTRQNLKGQLFFALKGDNFDAHSFLDKAVAAGASGLVVEKVSDTMMPAVANVSVFVVEDTLKALQNLARHRRRQSTAKVIGITGSNGKTTSKEFTAALLSNHFRVHYNKGSFNNHWGVPLTLLGIQPEHQVVICEMGMNHAGELTDLVEIAEPEITVVTTVGRAHLEGLGSIESVARAKEEIYLAAAAKTTRIFNLDNVHCKKMLENTWRQFPEGKILSFSMDGDPIADVKLKVKAMSLKDLEIKGEIQGVSGEVRVSVFGVQNLTNLMVAASCGLSVGMTAEQIWKSLPSCKTVWGRNQLVHLRSGAEAIFDGYNANPDSMKALLENLRKLSRDKDIFLILGEMRELGQDSASLHMELGRLAADVGCKKIWFAGEHFKEFEKGFSAVGDTKKLTVSKDYDEAMMPLFQKELGAGTLVAVKGSRGMKMERFLTAMAPLDFQGKD